MKKQIQAVTESSVYSSKKISESHAYIARRIWEAKILDGWMKIQINDSTISYAHNLIECSTYPVASETVQLSSCTDVLRKTYLGC